MKDPATIVVRFTREGFHRWPDAPPGRHYLSLPHRHLFHVEARLAVTHDDREVEFHDFLDFCRTIFGGGSQTNAFGFLSCEALARALLAQILERYGDRSASVAVFEDGEVGAIVDHAL